MKDATYKSGLVLYFVVWSRRLVLYFVAWCRSDVVNLVLGFLLLRFFSFFIEWRKLHTFKEFTLYDFLSHKTEIPANLPGQFSRSGQIFCTGKQQL